MSVYNGERYLREAVDSILSQTFRDFEFLVINDGSTDSSASILQEYASDPRIKVIQQENRGLIASLNRALDAAQGELIARMDADDVALPERLDLQAAYLEQNREITALGGAVEFISSTGDRLTTHRYVTGSDDIRAGLLDQNVVWHPTVLMRRSVVAEAGGYRPVPRAEDYDLWLRLSDCGKVANLDTVVLQYRIHADQTTGRHNDQMTISALVSRAAAFARRSGSPDPLEAGPTITAGLLAEMTRLLHPLSRGEAGSPRTPEQESRLRSYFRWILQAALVDRDCQEAALQALRSDDWNAFSPRERAEAHYASARIEWARGEHRNCVMSAAKAILHRPSLVAKPFKPLWRALSGERRPDNPWQVELSDTGK